MCITMGMALPKLLSPACSLREIDIQQKLGNTLRSPMLWHRAIMLTDGDLE